MCFNTTKLMHSVLLLASLFLTACGGGGGGSASPPTPPPAAPTGVTASPGDGYVLLNGNSVTGATAYNIYWSTTPTPAVSKSNGTRLPATSTPQAHTGLTNGITYYYVATAVGAGGESADSLQASATPAAATPGPDPLYGDQWHLKNTGQQGAVAPPGLANEDMNVEPAWASNYKGNGVRIAIVDDGLEVAHEDLASNMAANGQSYNYVNLSSDPTNDPADTTSGHGTECAGIAASRDSNGLGGSGVAPRATLVGYNLLQNQTITNEIDAMTRNAASVSVSSNSWGATDGTGELTTRTTSWQGAIDDGILRGRNAKGTIYLWAAGNGAAGANGVVCPSWLCSDNSNYDGQANYRGVMAVGAVSDQGLQSTYSESGANLWVAAPGGEFCYTHAITTTDRTGAVGHNTAATAGVSDYANQNYTKCMNGTSAATPGAAGVVALMLAANPNLGWRDVRIILAQTARANDPGTCNVLPAPVPCLSTNTGWVLNGTGTSSATNPRYYFNHKYGFGVVDADAAVKTATGAIVAGVPVVGTPVPWPNVGPELTYTTPLSSPASVITDPTTAVPAPAATSNTIAVAGSGINSIEWVDVTFTAVDPFTGDLDVALTNNQSGMVSQLAVAHSCAGAQGACTSSYSGWVFGSAAHLGEAANGNWTLTVKDVSAGGGNGTFSSWQLKFYGH